MLILYSENSTFDVVIQLLGPVWSHTSYWLMPKVVTLKMT